MSDIILTVGDKIEFLEHNGLWSVPSGDLTPTELVDYVDAHFVNLDIPVVDALAWRASKVNVEALPEVDTDSIVSDGGVAASEKLESVTKDCLNRVTLRMIELDDAACDKIVDDAIDYITTNTLNPTGNFQFKVITHHATATFASTPTYSMLSPDSIIRLAGRFAAAKWYVDLNTLSYVDDLFVPVQSELEKWTQPNLSLYWLNPLSTDVSITKCIEIHLIGGVRGGVKFVK